MEMQKVKTCFTITFTDDQFTRAKDYVDDMKRHPNRVFWRGKEGKTDQELIIEQIAHRVLSGFYNDDPFRAGRQIIKMDSAVNGH
jgi:tripartite-type tricarboxylate transporter receptor subunit TctC